MPASGRRIAAVCAGFPVALAAVWAVQSLTVGAAFGPGNTPVWPALVLPPLAGLAVFALVFGVISGTMPRHRYWLSAPLLTYGLVALGYLGIFRGHVTPLEAFVAVAVLLFAAALVLLGRERLP